MKKLVLTSTKQANNDDFFLTILATTNSKDKFIETCKSLLDNLTIEFYDYIGKLLS